MRKVIIMGAAGRDFHNFNVYFRDNPGYRVVALLLLRYLILKAENIRQPWPENSILREYLFILKPN